MPEPIALPPTTATPTASSISSPPCAQPAACSPRTRPGCCGPDARTPAELVLLTRRRLAGEPLEHVLGWAEFAGLRVAVEPGVFVPRHRSEFLVDEAVAAVPGARVVVDLCCGSGAIGAALLQRLSDVELHAADVDAVAVRCARRTLGDRGEVHEGDLFAALPPALRGRVDLLVASTPYVPSDAVRLMPPEAREHEPLVALDGGRDGLDVVRRLIAEAPAWLAPAGVVAVERATSRLPLLTRPRPPRTWRPRSAWTTTPSASPSSAADCADALAPAAPPPDSG